MAQVYSFVDENGQTRLLAEIVPDPAGTPFNGGTITAPLQIDTATAPQLLVQDSAGGSSMIETNSGETLLSSPGAGNARSRITLDTSGDLGVQAATGGQVALSGGGGSAALNIKDATDTPVRSEMFGYLTMRDKTIVLRMHAAPADGDLVAGECALWFDQTNGAAKLMAKGKTANGTVVAASIALA